MIRILIALAKHWGFTFHEYPNSVSVHKHDDVGKLISLCCMASDYGKIRATIACIDHIRNYAKGQLHDSGIHATAKPTLSEVAHAAPVSTNKRGIRTTCACNDDMWSMRRYTRRMRKYGKPASWKNSKVRKQYLKHA